MANTRDFNRRSVRSEMGIVLQIMIIYPKLIASNVGSNNESIQPETIKELVKWAEDILQSDEDWTARPKKGDGFSSRGIN